MKPANVVALEKTSGEKVIRLRRDVEEQRQNQVAIRLQAKNRTRYPRPTRERSTARPLILGKSPSQQMSLRGASRISYM